MHKNFAFLTAQLAEFWRKDLDRFPYKFQLTEELKSNDHLQRRQFADCALEQLEIDPDFGKKTSSLSTKPHFWFKWLRKQAEFLHLG